MCGTKREREELRWQAPKRGLAYQVLSYRENKVTAPDSISVAHVAQYAREQSCCGAGQNRYFNLVAAEEPADIEADAVTLVAVVAEEPGGARRSH